LKRENSPNTGHLGTQSAPTKTRGVCPNDGLLPEDHRTCALTTEQNGITEHGERAQNWCVSPLLISCRAGHLLAVPAHQGERGRLSVTIVACLRIGQR
jgi:hypothetical protein